MKITSPFIRKNQRNVQMGISDFRCYLKTIGIYKAQAKRIGLLEVLK